MQKENIFHIVLNAVALAMGVASVTLIILGVEKDTIIILMAIGLACLGLVGLDKVDK